MNEMHRGRGWARTGFWTGVIASVAANIAHAFLAGQPSYLMLLFATLPPFALLIGIEVIAQVRWRKVWYQALIRWGAVGSVAGIGGVVSYDHMRQALEAHGETGIGAYLLPILVDGLMTVCSAALLTIGDNIRRVERAQAAAIEAAEAQAAAEAAARAEAEAEQTRKLDIPERPAIGRPAAVTRQLALDLLSVEPDLTPAQIAERLGIKLKRYKEVMATA